MDEMARLFVRSAASTARMRACWWRRVALACATWALLANLPVARGGELSTALSSLFELGTEATTSAIASARNQYERLKRSYPEDRRIDYAYGVVLIGQHKYRDAVPLISGYLETGKSEPHAYCAKIWAQLQAREYGGLLNEAVTLSDRFPKGSRLHPEAAYHEAAEFLGAVFGYLELLRAGAVDPQLRLERKNRVLGRLGPAYTLAFDQGRASVGQQVAEFQAQREAEIREVTAKVEKRKDQAKSALDVDRNRLLAEEGTQQSSVEQLRNAQRQLNQIQRELSTLNQERIQVGARIALVQAQINAILVPTFRDDRTRFPTGAALILEYQPAKPYDPRVVQANALAVALAVLSKQAFEMDRWILEYQTRAAILNGKGEETTLTLAQSEADAMAIQKRSKSAEYQLKRLEKPARARSGVLSEKMAMLSTYAPFPYAQERQRVLGWFAK